MAHSDWVRAWRCCQAERASSAAGTTTPQKLWTLGTAPWSATFDMGSFARCVAALPDDLHFVVGTRKEVRLHHVDGTLVHTFTGHTNTVYAVAVTPDGQHIISGAGDHTVKVWSVATKSLVSTCEGTPTAFKPWRRCPTASASSAPTTTALRSACGSSTAPFQEHPPRTTTQSCSARFGPSWRCPTTSTRFASADETVKLFNVNDGAVLRTFRNNTAAVYCLALLPDGRRFISGLGDATARIVEHGLAPQPALK